LLRQVANMLWAYATLNHQPNELFVLAIVSHAQKNLQDFSPQVRVTAPSQGSVCLLAAIVAPGAHDASVGCLSVSRKS
jgi:hypothetical protein